METRVLQFFFALWSLTGDKDKHYSAIREYDGDGMSLSSLAS